MLYLTLVHFGHFVIEARNGVEGLRIHAVEAAGIVFTDIIMPEKEGLEVIMELRHTVPSPRIIAMLGGGRMTARDYLRLAQKLGAGVILEKPFANGAWQPALATVLRALPAAV